MATNKYKYVDNKSVYDSTEILVVGDYAARQGDVIPITKDVLGQIESIFELTEDSGEITATKLGDEISIEDLVDEEDEKKYQQILPPAPTTPSATSSSEGTLKDATGSGVAK